MMKERSSIFVLSLLTITLLGLSSAFELNQIQRNIETSLDRNGLTFQEDCKTASIYEYINKFSLPLKDVEKLLVNQFSRNEIADFEASNKVKLFNITCVSKLLSGDQSQSSVDPFKVIVYNNQIEFTITYKLNITEGTTIKKTHTFGAVTKVSNVSITYEKEFNLNTGTFLINSATVKIQTAMMNTTYNTTTNKTEDDSFDIAIKGASPSLYTTLVKLFSNDIVKQSMQSNMKGDHLSKIYAENPYNYKFYSTNISIDLSSISFTTKDTSLTSGMIGKLPQGNNFCSQFVPDFTDTGASLFISKQFVQNFVQYNVAVYPGWKNIRIDKKTVRSTLLQWQLLDLEFIVDGLWNDLGEFFQNEIYFTCNVQDQLSTKFESQKNRLHQAMKWECQGFVKLNGTVEQKVMDFVPRIDHIAEVKILDGALNLYVNVLQVIDCQFNEVTSLNGQGKYAVGPNGGKLANKFMESVFNDFRVYPIGDRFQVNSQANSVQVETNGNGLWVL